MKTARAGSLLGAAVVALVIPLLSNCAGSGGGANPGGGGKTGGGAGVIVDLGTSPTGDIFEALGLNDKGDTTLLSLNVTSAAFRSASGVVTPLPPVNGGAAVPVDLNASGVVVGQSGQAVEWVNGVLKNLPLSNGMSPSNTGALFINDAGQIVGTNAVGQVTQTLYWATAQTQPATLTPSGLNPVGINNKGLLVGFVVVGGTHEWYTLNLASGTAAKDLQIGSSDPNGTGFVGALPGGIAVNNGGTIVCESGVDNAVIEISPTGTKKQIFKNAFIYSINDQGDVVGNTEGTTTVPSVPFIYTPSKGLVDLNTLLPANSHWNLILTRRINNLGQVVGVGTHNGTLAGFLFQLPKGSF